MGIFFLIGIHIILLICVVSSMTSIEICSNVTQIENVVRFSKSNETKRSCGCSVNANWNSTVIFEPTGIPRGCQYRLIFSWNSNTAEYNCMKYSTIYQFTVTPTDQLYLYLVIVRNNTSGFVFNFTVETRGPPVTFTCRSPWTNPQVTTQTSPTAVGVSRLLFDSTTTVGGSSIQYDSTTSTSGQTESTETTDRNQLAEEPQTSDLPVIVGCTVSGVVLVSVTVIILICFLKRRHQKHLTDTNVSDINITDRKSYSDCYDNIPTSFIQTENNNTESMDIDLDKSKQGKPALEQPEPVPEQLEHVPEQLEPVPEQLERFPITSAEYAVVTKKPKKGASQNKRMELNNNPNIAIKHDDYENLRKDDLNLKMEINRIVGPKGDDYTLVNKLD